MLADEEADKVDKDYIDKNCDEYTLPCLEYNVDAPAHE